MGFILGLIKRIFKLSLCFLIFAAIVVLIPNLPPYTEFTSIQLDPTQPRTGPLAPNDALNKAEKVYVDKLLGPEAFQLYKGELYTSLATGEIVKVSPGGHITFVTKIGQPCTGLIQEHICGRPLGFQIDESKNVMYVADAYHGIWKVDLKSDKKQLLVSPRVLIDGRAPKLFNSVALGKNGDLYWTDSSSDFQLKDGAMSMVTDPSGRLFFYNAAKNQSNVLLDKLWFPNGVVISTDNQFVVVAETSRYQLIKHYIDGPKKGKTEVFVSGLPGVPDNVRALPDGSGLLVGLYTTFDEEHPLLTRSMAAAPAARKFVARLQRLVEIPFDYLNTVYPHVVFEDIVYHIGHFKSVSGIVPKSAGLVQIDWQGNIVASYYNTDGSLQHISDAIVFNGRLLTGSPHEQNFIGSLPAPPLLKKAFETKPETAKQAKPVEAPRQAKPVETPKAKPVETPKAKPVETPKQAKPVETPKPKAEEKPKVEVKKDAPKPAQEKPVQQAKAPEAAKPKPVEQLKPVQQKPTTPPPKAEPKGQPAQPKQETKPTPKPEIKTSATPKPTPKSTLPPSKPEPKAVPAAKPTAKPEVKAEPAKPKPEKVTKPKETQKPVKEEPKPSKLEHIPIKEEIPSDTTKPAKETLKVIKKGGPAEIPNPNLV